MEMGFEDVPRCQHIKVNGVQCGSPALRRKAYCYFHERVQYERKLAAENNSAPRNFGFPLLEDANSIQVALMKIVQMLGAGCLDIKTAGLMLYALQTASANLRHAKFEPEQLTDVIIDEDTVDLTRLSGPQWASHNFAGKANGKREHETDAQLSPDENPGPGMIVNQSVADITKRREEKRKLAPYTQDGPENESEHSLAKYLLDRMFPGWQEQEAGTEATGANATPS
jgi:hypothetical protein